jgi:hypothetical protein
VPTVTPKRPDKWLCNKCHTKVETLHCFSPTCNWFFCGKCGVVSDPETQHYFSYAGPRKA